MTFADMAEKVGVPFCGGECGITVRSHATGFIFLDVIHFRERRFTRRGAKNFLMLVAKRRRLLDAGFLNTPDYDWLYPYLDSTTAQMYARLLGFRIPARLFDMEREQVRLLAHKRGVRLSLRPAIASWVQR